MRPIHFAAALLAFCLCGFNVLADFTTKPATRETDRLPPAWSLPALAHATLTNEDLKHIKDEDVHAKVLTWKIEEDDRPLYIESCIVWTHVTPPNGKAYWRLTHLYRHPKQKDPGGTEPLWHISRVTDLPFQSFHDYDHPPKNAEVYEFLKGTWWTLKPDDNFKLLDADVCANAWQEATGEKPAEANNESHQSTSQ